MGKRAPYRTDEFGSPGSHALLLMRRRLAISGGYTAVALAASVVAAVMLAAGRLAVAVVAGGAAAVFFLAARGMWVEVRRAMVGARSERRVAKVLRRTGAEVVVHGAVLGDRGGDLDHAVIGPVVVAVETKTGYGQVRVDREGSLWAGRRRIPKNPVAQVGAQARRLSKAVGLPAEAVVCVVDMENRPFTHSGVTICSLRDLPAVVAAAPTPVAAGTAHARAVRVVAPN